MIDASLGKTGSALILLLRGHGWRPQPQLLSRQISEQQQTQSVKCWIYSPLCATTCQQEHLLSCSSLKPGFEARLRAWSFSAGRADVNVCTGTQLWKEKSISCWDNLWRRSCTKSPILWCSEFYWWTTSKPRSGSHFTNNPINSAFKTHPSSTKGSNCSTTWATWTVRGIQNANSTRNTQFGPLLSLNWNWILRPGPCFMQVNDQLCPCLSGPAIFNIWHWPLGVLEAALFH